MTAPGALQPRYCAECGVELPVAALACPACQRLVHRDELQRLSAEAASTEARGDLTEALRLWREALTLLPPDTQQYRIVENKLRQLSDHVDTHVPAPVRPKPNWFKRLGPLAPIALLLWKFKAVIFVALSKGKLLLFGLSKLSTLSTMLLSLGAYWALYGWWFGLGLVLSIYVHEMGHVYALRQFGIPATAPMFIPMLGAMVRMKHTVLGLKENARIGLAGPIWGTTAAIAMFVFYAATDKPVIGAIAHFGVWINLFNLIPVWQLDGARGVSALNRSQRGMLLLITLLTLVLTREGFLAIIAGFLGWRLFTRDWTEEGDQKAFIQFAGLILVLGVLLAIPVPPAIRR